MSEVLEGMDVRGRLDEPLLAADESPNLLDKAFRATHSATGLSNLTSFNIFYIT